MRLIAPEKFKKATEVLGVKVVNGCIDVEKKISHRFIRLGFKTDEPNKDKEHRCKYCGKVFDNFGKLMHHYRECDKK